MERINHLEQIKQERSRTSAHKGYPVPKKKMINGELVVDNLFYEDICAKNYLYIGKGDFYGHRRQGMAAIKRWMILYGIWEI